MLEFSPLSGMVSELASAIIAGFVAWFFARRKFKAEATASEIGNAKELVGLYKDSLDDLGNRYELKYQELEKRADNMQKLYEEKERILLQEIEYHKKQAALYKRMYKDKVKEFNDYKKNNEKYRAPVSD